jgi:hypothetical protein
MIKQGTHPRKKNVDNNRWKEEWVMWKIDVNKVIFGQIFTSRWIVFWKCIKHETLWFKRIFGPFSEIKMIKLTTSIPNIS